MSVDAKMVMTTNTSRVFFFACLLASACLVASVAFFGPRLDPGTCSCCACPSMPTRTRMKGDYFACIVFKCVCVYVTEPVLLRRISPFPHGSHWTAVGAYKALLQCRESLPLATRDAQWRSGSRRRPQDKSKAKQCCPRFRWHNDNQPFQS